MLSANRYVTRNGTFDPYYVSLQVRSAINHPKGCLEPGIPLEGASEQGDRVFKAVSELDLSDVIGHVRGGPERFTDTAADLTKFLPHVSSGYITYVGDPSRSQQR
jgi:hypothetical protein